MTTTMERTSVTFSKVQLAWLKREAKRLGIGLGELLRRIVDTGHPNRGQGEVE